MDNILVIDDDKDLLTIVKSILQKKQFEVSVFHEWEKAFSYVKTSKPHLILLDVFLGNLDGLQLCKKLKRSVYSSNIPIIILSGFSGIGKTAIHEFGADDFIAKPINETELINKIQNLLSKKHHLV